MSQSNITQTIIDTINTIFNNLFSSIDNNLYSILDKLLFINTDFLNNSFFENVLGHSVTKSLLIIANSLLVGFTIYYCFKLLFSHFSYVEIEKPYQFIFKIIIFAICMNSSYFICEKIIELNYLISDSICEVGKNIFNTDISFSNLIQKLDSLIVIGNNSFDIFSVDGIIKSFISIGLFNLIFSYSLRYILLKVFVLISPFAFLTLINYSTSWFFKTWIKALLSLLLLQSFTAIILLIIFSFNFDVTNLFSKFLLIGGIYALTKSTSYMKELLGGVTTDVQINFLNFKNK